MARWTLTVNAYDNLTKEEEDKVEKILIEVAERIPEDVNVRLTESSTGKNLTLYLKRRCYT